MNTKTSPPDLWPRLLAALSLVALIGSLSSCTYFNPLKPEPEPEPEPPVAEKKPPPEPTKPPPPSPLYEWYGRKGNVSHIEVSINEQKARFFSGDQQVGWTTIASGVYKHPTPIGTFAVLEKVQNKKSNLYGRIYNKNGKLVKRNAKIGVDSIPAGGSFKGASMPYFLRLTNDGIGMHAGPIPRPGNRASHGCIRMPKRFAPILYHHVNVGARVTIIGKGPTYGNYAAKQRRSTPKPTPKVAAATQPSPLQAAGATPVSTPTNERTTGQPKTTAGLAATAPESVAAQITAPASISESAVAQTPSAASVPGNASDYVPFPPWSPVTELESPTADVTSAPAYPTTYSIPAAGPAATTDAVPPVVISEPVAELENIPSSSPSDSGLALPTPAISPASATPEAPTSKSVRETTGTPVSPAKSTGQPDNPDDVTPPPTAVEASGQNQG